MNPRFLNKLKKKRIIRSAIFAFGLLLISSLILPLRTPFLYTLKHPLYLLTLIAREVKGFVFYHHNMVQKERLSREADLLKQKINYLNEIRLENERLSKLLSLKQNSPYKALAARVIGHSPDNWSSVIIIDKGSDSGIKRGFVALSHLGLAGRVIEATASTSKVMLINDPNLSVSGLVQRSRQEGLVSGTLGSTLIMRYLSKDSDIKVSDVIITSGLTDVYPKGLLIGTAVDIGEEFSGLSRYCLIKPAVNLSSIEEVLIIIP